MLEKFFQLNKIGKELGLSKKEINSVLLFDDSKHPSFYQILLIIFFIFLGLLFFNLINFFASSRNIYPAGTLYSTVKIEDFKGKK